MTPETHASKADAIYQVIAPALDVPGVTGVQDFDADAIFDRAFTYDDRLGAYRQTATGPEFWAIVDECAI